MTPTETAFEMGKSFAEYINGHAAPLSPDTDIPSMERMQLQTLYGWCGKTLSDAWKRGFNSILGREKTG